MATILRTNIVEIGRAAAARLSDLSVVASSTQIVWSGRREAPHFKGKKDIVIRPRRGQDIRSFEAGGQRYGMVCIRVLDIIARTSLATSDGMSDEGWLEQHTEFEDAILNALAGQMLIDKDENDFLTCPLKYLGTTEETKEAGPTKNLWGNSVLSFECHYKPKLDLSQVT